MSRSNAHAHFQVVAFVSITFIILSTVSLTLNTIPSYQEVDKNGRIVSDNQKLATIEAVCITWFTAEFLMRFASSPSKKKFLKGALNLIDLLAIMPYFISLLFASKNETNQSSNQQFDNVRRIQILRQYLRRFGVLALLHVRWTISSSSPFLFLLILVLSKLPW